MMFRCIPAYNVTGAKTSYCVYPPGVTEAFDPRCIVQQDDSTGSVQKPAKPNLLFDQLNTGRQLWGRWFGDLARAWWVILACAVGVALVLGFVWVTFLKYFTACMVWSTIFLVITLLTFLTGFFYYKAGLVNVEVPPSLNDEIAVVQSAATSAAARAQSYVPQSWTENTDQYQISYRSVAYASNIFLILILCIVIAMRNAIRTAIEVIKIGSEALRALPTLLFFPCTNVLCIGLFLIWWLFVAACLVSAGEVKVEDVAKDLELGLDALQAQYGTNLTAAQSAALLASLGNLNTTMR
jgi:hypothetical protein